ncbi:condensation domain-containing protein [Legionella cincinnatiensis]|uniref:Surfactin synthase subunit 2 n=1 Tax=Legionella cincinnatiensis TaxID=28085 RepID=A0A378ILK0_9GAMM|nr:condensation domain-containing protein [Legionella cincinnatiensis]KTC83449.1 Surfactin synthase subunit 2 [Legionella cincinnatiensis]STX35535.1 Surfactin synthase subunit 2 [Legionella cincinnatiensis]
MIKIEASSYQKNFYLEWKLDPDSIKYNLFLLFEIHGTLDIQLLEKSIIQFINYGQNQRTFFIEEENKLKQVIVDNIKNFELEFYDISHLNENAKKCCPTIINIYSSK